MTQEKSSLAVGVSTQSGDSFVNERDFFASIEKSDLIAEFSTIRRLYGFRTALKSFLVKKKYIVKLWLVREAAIIRTLSKNYEKIPKKTISRLIVSVYLRSAWLRKKLWKIENLLNPNFI